MSGLSMCVMLSFCCQVVTVLIFCICCVFFVYYTSNRGALGGVVFDLSGAPPSSCSHHSKLYIEVAIEANALVDWSSSMALQVN